VPFLLLGIVPDAGSSQEAQKTPTGDPQTGDRCIPNISLPERRRRLASGAILFVLALALFGLLMATGADRWWRLALFPLFYGAATGFFQWRDKT
jgi:hypothetical protein